MLPVSSGQTGGSDREEPESSESRDVYEYTATPFCVCCGWIDNHYYSYRERRELLEVTCSRCGFVWMMQPRWTIPADQITW